MKIKTKTYTQKGFLVSLLIKLKLYLNALQLRSKIKRERLVLRGLNAHELKDIGISHEDAIHEATRHYADIPSNRTF